MKMFKGIKNLIKWRTVIWNDSDWDYEAFLIILETKLNFMAEAFKSDKANSLHSVSHAKDMEKCAALCRYIIEGKSDHFYDELDRKWGEAVIKVDPSTHIVTFERGKIKTKADEVQFNSEFRTAWTNVELEERDKIQGLFKRIANNLIKWWD